MFAPATQAVLIGGSAGALVVLLPMLAVLPPEFPIAVVVVVHQPRQTRTHLVAALSAHSRLPVCEAHDKQPLVPGAIYVAPPDYHLLVDPGPVLSLSVDDPVNYARPSIDVLFESAAGVLGPACAAVLLSGANSDGASGLRAIRDAGGLAVVQSPEDSEHATMPGAGLTQCPDALVLPKAGLRGWILRLTDGHPATEQGGA